MSNSKYKSRLLCQRSLKAKNRDENEGYINVIQKATQSSLTTGRQAGRQAPRASGSQAPSKCLYRNMAYNIRVPGRNCASMPSRGRARAVSCDLPLVS